MKKKTILVLIPALLFGTCSLSGCGNLRSSVVEETKDTFSLTSNFDSTKGNVSLSASSGEVGATVSVTITPNDGYLVDEVSFNGSSLTPSLSFSVTPVKGENVLEVTFKKDSEYNPEPENGVSKDDLGVLYGDFYSASGKLHIDENGVVLTNSDEDFDFNIYSKETVDIEKIETTVFNVGFWGQYRVYLSNAVNKYAVLEKLNSTTGEFEKVDEFMPSVEEFNGEYYASYDGYLDFDSYTATETISNEFSYSRNAFLLRYGSNSPYYFFQNTNAHKILSYFRLINNEYVKCIELQDYSDYSYGTFYLEQKDGVNYLWSTENYDYAEYESCPGAFVHTYYFEEGDSHTFSYDYDTKAVTFDDVAYTLTSKADEDNGAYYQLTADGQTSYNVYPTVHGIKIENVSTNAVVYGGIDFNYYLSGTYELDGKELTFATDYDDDYNEIKTVSYDGASVEFSKVLLDGIVYYKANLGGKDYYFRDYRDDGSASYVILVNDGTSEEMVINKSYFAPEFVGTFINKNVNSVNEIVVDDELNLTYNDETIKAEIEYNDLDVDIFINFEVGGKSYKYSYYDASIKTFLLEDAENGNQLYFTKDSEIEKFYGTFTKAGKEDLVVSENGASFGGVSYDYSIYPFYSEYNFANFLTLELANSTESHTFLVDSSDTVYEYEGLNSDLTINATESYILVEDFEKLVGRYTLTTKYGEEDFELTSGGVFTGDTLNSIEGKLNEDVELKYHLSYSTYNSEKVPVIGFEFGGVTVFAYKVGTSLVVTSSYYAADYVHKFNGFYADASGEHSVNLYQNTLYYGDTSLTISSYEKVSEDMTKVVAGGYTFVFVKGSTNEVIVDDGSNTYILSQVDFDYTPFIGQTVTVGGTEYELQAVTDSITGIVTYRLVSDFMSYNLTTLTVKDGHQALYFSILSYKCYLYLVDGVVTVDVSGGSIPTPPPAPSL